MLNEVAKNWVKTLRSGEYAQGQNRLRYRDTYCCLGVLCELAVKEGVVSPGEYNHDYDAYVYEGNPNYLPKSVQEWAGIRDRHAEYGPGSHTLAARNDSGATFAEIADIIESEPPGLFKKEF